MQVHRLPNNPIISPDTPGYDRERMGVSINGPSLIRTPDWLPNALGKYYLYFANHSGTYIRLAYADPIEGPWRIYKPGTVQIEQTPFWNHIASPDVHVDDENKQIRMYFHGPVPDEERLDMTHGHAIHSDYPWPQGGQMTRVAVSHDGINFDVQPQVIATFYFRVFQHDGWHYGIAMPFICYRSRNGLTDWEVGPSFFDRTVRHCAVRKLDHKLQVYFTRREDCPEHIEMTELDLTPDWHDWQPSEPVDVLYAEHEWEGAHLPLTPSRSGGIHEPVHQLRDPDIFEEDGRTYLLYSVAGEAGIAIAELQD